MKNNVLYSKQFRFQKGHSTGHAIIQTKSLVKKHVFKNLLSWHLLVTSLFNKVLLACSTSSYKNNVMYLHQFDWTGEFYEYIHCLISALWTLPTVPLNLVYGNCNTDNWDIATVICIDEQGINEI